jgi:hypothetical protein
MTLLPDDRIQQMRERVEKATPGMLIVERCYDGARTVCQMRHPNELLCVNMEQAQFRGGPWEKTEANAELFANARTDLADLLRERKELLAERDRLAELLGELIECTPNCDCPDAFKLKDHSADCPYRRAVEWQSGAAEKGVSIETVSQH